ncbi:Translation machinery-associated protein 22 [Sorochytrium milnesiophthora]
MSSLKSSTKSNAKEPSPGVDAFNKALAVVENSHEWERCCEAYKEMIALLRAHRSKLVSDCIDSDNAAILIGCLKHDIQTPVCDEVAHHAIKLLAYILHVPALYSRFLSHPHTLPQSAAAQAPSSPADQHSSLLQVLRILIRRAATTSDKDTCHLAVWLLSTQRLPTKYLTSTAGSPTSTRIIDDMLSLIALGWSYASTSTPMLHQHVSNANAKFESITIPVESFQALETLIRFHPTLLFRRSPAPTAGNDHHHHHHHHHQHQQQQSSFAGTWLIPAFANLTSSVDAIRSRAIAFFLAHLPTILSYSPSFFDSVLVPFMDRNHTKLACELTELIAKNDVQGMQAFRIAVVLLASYIQRTNAYTNGFLRMVEKSLNAKRASARLQAFVSWRYLVFSFVQTGYYRDKDRERPSAHKAGFDAASTTSLLPQAQIGRKVGLLMTPLTDSIRHHKIEALRAEAARTWCALVYALQQDIEPYFDLVIEPLLEHLLVRPSEEHGVQSPSAAQGPTTPANWKTPQQPETNGTFSSKVTPGTLGKDNSHVHSSQLVIAGQAVLGALLNSTAQTPTTQRFRLANLIDQSQDPLQYARYTQPLSAPFIRSRARYFLDLIRRVLGTIDYTAANYWMSANRAAEVTPSRAVATNGRTNGNKSSAVQRSNESETEDPEWKADDWVPSPVSHAPLLPRYLATSFERLIRAFEECFSTEVNPSRESGECLITLNWFLRDVMQDKFAQINAASQTATAEQSMLPLELLHALLSTILSHLPARGLGAQRYHYTELEEVCRDRMQQHHPLANLIFRAPLYLSPIAHFGMLWIECGASGGEPEWYTEMLLALLQYITDKVPVNAVAACYALTYVLSIQDNKDPLAMCEVWRHIEQKTMNGDTASNLRVFDDHVFEHVTSILLWPIQMTISQAASEPMSLSQEAYSAWAELLRVAADVNQLKSKNGHELVASVSGLAVQLLEALTSNIPEGAVPSQVLESLVAFADAVLRVVQFPPGTRITLLKQAKTDQLLSPLATFFGLLAGISDAAYTHFVAHLEADTDVAGPAPGFVVDLLAVFKRLFDKLPNVFIDNVLVTQDLLQVRPWLHDQVYVDAVSQASRSSMADAQENIWALVLQRWQESITTVNESALEQILPMLMIGLRSKNANVLDSVLNYWNHAFGTVQGLQVPAELIELLEDLAERQQASVAVPSVVMVIDDDDVEPQQSGPADVTDMAVDDAAAVAPPPPQAVTPPTLAQALQALADQQDAMLNPCSLRELFEAQKALTSLMNAVNTRIETKLA